jgi:hypothetical protein
MNPAHFGDSYDLVKRFFCIELASIGYEVVIDPLFTGDWHGAEDSFYRLVNAVPIIRDQSRENPRALFLDPDTGVNKNGGKKHVPFSRIIDEAKNFEIVFSYDQSFSRSGNSATIMRKKVAEINALGCYAMYYDSHACFLFASVVEKPVCELHTHLLTLGLPENRLILTNEKVVHSR